MYEELQKSTAFVSHVAEIEPMYVYCKNADECIDCFFGVDMDLSFVDRQALQVFKKNHDEEVRNNPMPFNMLFVVLKNLS